MSLQAFKNEIDAIKARQSKAFTKKEKPLAKDNIIYEQNNSNTKTIQLLRLRKELHKLKGEEMGSGSHLCIKK